MPLVRVHNFSISLDGFGTGEGQTLDAPFGHAGHRLMEWAFETRTFRDLVSVHHRPIGSADGTVRGHARHGECAYIAHYTVAWVALRSLKIAGRQPRGFAGAAFFYGYLRAMLHGVERVPDEAFRDFTHRELRQRMWAGVTRPVSRPVRRPGAATRAV